MELLTIGLIVVGLWGAYRFGKNIGRRREAEAAELKKRIDNEQDPDRKQDLILLWARAREIHPHTRRAFEVAVTETSSGVSCYNRGVNARLAGDPLSSNPFGNRFWGRGKEWYSGWMWANENPDRAKTHKNG